MLNFLKTGVEFNNLAKAMNAMNVTLQELIPRVGNSSNKEEFAEDVIMLAYISVVGVWDRIEKYKWTIDAKITVPTIDKSRITLAFALAQTVGKAQILAGQLGIENDFQEILMKGPLFYEFDRHIPSEIKNNI